MSPDTLLENLFNEALERDDPVERARFLDEACGANAALREQVEKLVRGHEQAAGFMRDPSRHLQANPTGRLNPAQSERVGDTIGRYKLLEQIGEGGCGVVYMAEQEEPVRRRVALKVIKLGMDTKQVIARFDAERQALAMMDHANIAKVLDAGATETGRPYFVMELIRGVRITDFCDQQKVSTEERLKLFIQVCQAIQHAHQKGIIHRDIKPSNILVTVNDGVALPKVIDFGIAKATQGKLTNNTLFTAFEQFIGTPAYMSPEQAAMTSLDVDTRSDIYSLGVLLYEMLTGRPPFGQKELLSAGLDEMRRIIQEKEPPRPSTRLTLLGREELAAAAQRRQTEAPRLIHRVRGDLDWIVMKCLEKDRARRYETINGLARDIERHLRNEPVAARPPSGFYRFQKFVRRNKAILVPCATVAGALLASLGVAVWLRARQQTDIAVAHREAESARVEAAVQTQEARASEDKAREEAEAARRLAEANDQRRAMEAARSEREARWMRELFNDASSNAPASRNAELLREVMASAPPDARAETLYREMLALILQGQGKMSEALQIYREAAEEGDAKAQNSLAWFLATCPEPTLRDGAGAIRIAEEAVRVTGRADAGVLQTLAAAYAEAGQFGNAVAVQREALTLVADGEQKDDYSFRLKLYEENSPYRNHCALGSLTHTRLTEGRFPEAESLARECLTLREKEIPDDWLTSNIKGLLGESLMGQKKFADAEPWLLSGYEGLVERQNEIPSERKASLVHDALTRLVEFYAKTERPGEAAQWKQRLDQVDKTSN